MKFAGTALVFFRAFEVGQYVAVSPALRTQVGPVIVVLVLPADVQQAIDGAGAAQNPTSRPTHLPVVGLRLRLYWKMQCVARVVDGAKVTNRQPNPKPL